jgi:acetamidase/formamidase
VPQHRLDPTPATVVDVFSRERAPVLTVEPGDSVVVGSLDASGFLSRQRVPGETRPTMFTEPRGHCLTGPIAVNGAEPGTVLAVSIVSCRPGSWGWTVAGAQDTPLTRRLGVAGDPPAWLLWEIDVEAGTATNQLGLSRGLAPFLGVVGLPPAEAGEHSTVPPRAAGGGNIDCRELVAGSTLYLPVTVPGALLCVGDGHAAQGDGEVGGTAVECPMTTELVLDVVTDRPLDVVHAVTPTAKITFGFDADLNAATADALDAMLTWVQSLHGVTRGEALALASSAVDLRVTQIANQTWGVHAVLTDGLLERV